MATTKRKTKLRRRHVMWALPWLSMTGEENVERHGAWMLCATETMAKQRMIDGHTKPIRVFITIRKP